MGVRNSNNIRIIQRGSSPSATASEEFLADAFRRISQRTLWGERSQGRIAVSDELYQEIWDGFLALEQRFDGGSQPLQLMGAHGIRTTGTESTLTLRKDKSDEDQHAVNLRILRDAKNDIMAMKLNVWQYAPVPDFADTFREETSVQLAPDKRGDLFILSSEKHLPQDQEKSFAILRHALADVLHNPESISDGAFKQRK